MCTEFDKKRICTESKLKGYQSIEVRCEGPEMLKISLSGVPLAPPPIFCLLPITSPISNQTNLALNGEELIK